MLPKPPFPVPDFSDIPKWIFPTLITMTCLAAIPFALIAKARTTHSPVPRVELIQNMDSQPKYKAQAGNAIFRDGRAMRRQPAGTVARGELNENDHLHRGVVGDGWATGLPMPLDATLLDRGKERYDIFCSPCHGLTGNGDGIVAQRADALQQGTWTPPSSLHTDLVRGRADGYLFNVITNGVRNMPAYGSQMKPADRWAIVGYTRVLQRSQNASLDDVPASERGRLR